MFALELIQGLLRCAALPSSTDDESRGKPRPLVNIAGGGGGCKGFVRMRAGPYPIWYGGGGSAVTGRVVWCGVTAFQVGAHAVATVVAPH